MLSGKPFSLYKRNRVYYVQFKLNNGTWSTAKSTGLTSRGQAEAWSINYLQGGNIVANERLTVREFSKNFFSWDGEWAMDKRVTGKRITPRQCKEKTRILDSTIIPILGKTRLSGIDKQIIKSFRNDLFTRGLAGSTINKALSCLKAILEDAEEKNLLRALPKIDRAANRSKQRGILTIEEVRQLFTVEWDNYRAYVMNLAAACTGLRRGELLALTIADINSGHILVSKSWDESTRTLNQTTKTGRSRTVMIPAQIDAAFNKLANDNPWGGPKAFLFYSSIESCPMDGKVVIKALYGTMKNIGIDETQRKERNLTFHSWRHWFNSLLINARVPLQKIQSLTGHLTNEMSQHYYHVDEMGDVVEAIESTLFFPTIGNNRNTKINYSNRDVVP